jgi:hypothetical protein
MNTESRIIAQASLNIWKLMILRDAKERGKQGLGESPADSAVLAKINRALDELEREEMRL